MTVESKFELLKEVFDNHPDLAKVTCFYDSRYDNDITDEFSKFGFSSVKGVDHHGGEGEGDQYWSVVEFVHENETFYVKFYGWYASHYGSDYQGFEQVKPKQVVTTIWE